MRLFNRIGDIIAANLNDLVDRLEDPEVMLKQAIREMETIIDEATGSAAHVIARERLLARDVSEHEQKAASWRASAEEAVMRGDDNQACVAIACAQEHEVIGQALIQQRQSVEKSAQALRSQVAAMRAKQSEARRKLESLSARRQIAQTSRDFHGMVSRSTRGPNGFARFEKMQRQIDQADAEAEILGELYETVEATLEAEIEKREQNRRIENELVAIKKRVSASGPRVG